MVRAFDESIMLIDLDMAVPLGEPVGAKELSTAFVGPETTHETVDADGGATAEFRKVSLTLTLTLTVTVTLTRTPTPTPIPTASPVTLNPDPHSRPTPTRTALRSFRSRRLPAPTTAPLTGTPRTDSS